MSSTQDRITQLIDENLEVDGQPLGRPLDLDLNIAEAGVPSTDVVAFWKLVNREFHIDIPAEVFAELLTVRKLIEYLDTNAG